jgi:hypothetical protein
MGVHKVSAFHPFIFQKSGKSTIIKNLAVPRHFAAYLMFISSIRVDPGPRNRGPTTLLALKICTPVAITGKLRSIGQVPVVKTSFRIRYELHIMLCDLLAHLTQRIVVSYIQASAGISVGIHKFDKLLHFNFL